MTDAAAAAAQDAVRPLRTRIQAVDDTALDLLFHEGRTFNGWQHRNVPNVLLHRHQVDFLCNLGCGEPTSIFQRSPRFEIAEACQIA